MAMDTWCCCSWHGYMLVKLQAVVIAVLVSQKAKFEVGTTSVILSYLYHFGNVTKELFRYY